MLYRILVIDDEYKERKEFYDLLVNEVPYKNFIIKDALRLDDIAVEAKKANLAIVDIILNPDQEPLYLNDINIIDFLYDQNPQLPVYLISKHWEQIENETFLKEFLKNRIVGGTTYNSLNNYSERGKIYSEILKNILNARDNVALDIGPDSNIIALHLSDLQFGGNWEGIGDDLDSKYAYIINDLISSMPIDSDGNKIIPHILLITGDIAQTGSPNEYKIAHKHLTNLCSELEIPQEARFIVPGNHDNSMPLCSSSNISYSFKNKKAQVLKDLTFNYNYGLSPFRDFAYSFTGRNEWQFNIKSIDLPTSGNCYFSTIYSDYGVNIIGISSVSMVTLKDPGLAKVHETLITDLAKQIQYEYENNRDNINLVLIHHSPWPDADKSLHKDGLALLSKLYNYNDTVLAFGHRHCAVTNVRPFTDDVSKNVLYSIAPTPSLVAVDRDPDTLRGFNYLFFNRKHDKVIGCEARQYQFKKPIYKSEPSVYFERNIGNGWFRKINL